MDLWMQFWRTDERRRRGSIAGARPAFIALAAIAGLLFPAGARAQALEQTRSQFLSGNYESVIQTARKQLEDGAYVED